MLLIYCRVSTAEQASDDKSSLEIQERVGRGFAMTKGFTQYNTAIYQDPGVSASIALRERPAGKRLLDDAAKGDTVFASKLDRMFRSAHDAINMAEIFKERGINLVLFNLGTEPVNGTGIGEFFFTIMAGVAQLERTLIKERMLNGKIAKIAKGGHAGGEAPYGIRIVGHGRDARRETNEAEQKLIEEIRVRIERESINTAYLTRDLNEAGFRARNGKPLLYMQVCRIRTKIEEQNAADERRVRRAMQDQLPALSNQQPAASAH